MTPRRTVSAANNSRQHPAAAGKIALPTDWSPEQAVAVFAILDELRERVWVHYGLQIQQVLRDERSKAVPAAHGTDIDDDDDDDVPF